MIDILLLINDYDWLFDQYITQNKTALQISNELGINDGIVGKYLRKAEIEIRKTYQSYVSKLWMESISKTENIIIEYEYQFNVYNKRLKADGYCQETNTIYEFHGDYWHGNPEIYSPDFYNKSCYKTMGELYQKTIERENSIQLMGYNLIIMWENQWNNIQ